MSLTISSGTRIGPGVALQSGAISTPITYPQSILFELDASTYTAGDWIESKGNGRNGVLYGSVYWDSDAGGCFVFNGSTTNRIDVTGSDVLSGAPAQATFSVWANIAGAGGYQHVAGWRGGINFWFLILSGGATTEARFDNGYPRDIGMDYSPYFNTWAQTTFVVDAANNRTKLYINSVEVGSISDASGNFNSANNLFSLGCNTGGGNFAMTGKIGGATAYNAALTNGEVLAEFNRTKGRYGL